MPDISRRQLFAMGAAAAVAPVLPAVLVPTAPAVGTTFSSFAALDAFMGRLLDAQVEHLVRQIEGSIMAGDQITFAGDPRTYIAMETLNG